MRRNDLFSSSLPWLGLKQEGQMHACAARTKPRPSTNLEPSLNQPEVSLKFAASNQRPAAPFEYCKVQRIYCVLGSPSGLYIQRLGGALGSSQEGGTTGAAPFWNPKWGTSRRLWALRLDAHILYARFSFELPLGPRNDLVSVLR